MESRVQVVLYTRPGCRLCEEMKEAMSSSRAYRIADILSARAQRALLPKGACVDTSGLRPLADRMSAIRMMVWKL